MTEQITRPRAAQQNPPEPAAPPARVNRMTLATVQRSLKPAPYRLVTHGTDGVGKTTFAASAPNPIFICAENGTEHVDVARFPSPETWQDILDAIATLTTEPHEYRTVVVDSLDWAEPLCWEHVCRVADKPDIEAFGYGKGYLAAIDEWRKFLAAIERLQATTGMHAILVAHTIVKSFKNPEGDDYERYQLKLHDKAAGLIREWASGVYFLNYETFAKKVEPTNPKSKRAKGMSSGARWMYTQRTAAYDAKDRYGLPPRLPLSWDEFEAAVAAGRPASPEALREAILAAVEELGDEKIAAWCAAEFVKSSTDATRLAIINDRLNGKLAQKREQEA